MIIPVRCFSCGKVIASDFRRFEAEVKLIKDRNREPTADEVSKIMDGLGLERYCCRRMILSHIELIDEIMPFS